MKSKGIRLIARLILWIGVIACLVGTVLALLLAMNNPLGIPTDYVPQTLDFIILGAGLVVVILLSVILFVIANAAEKREQIRACWAAAAAEEAVEAEEEEEVAEETEEAVEEETEEVVEEVVEEQPKTKLQVIREKLMEKAHISEEQYEKAKKVGKVAVPVGAAVVVLAMVAKLGRYQRQASFRRSFYKWLG